MLERELQEIANAIISSLIEHGSLPQSTDVPKIEATDTGGYWCKIAEVKYGIINLWLDPYRSHDRAELYYGFWSADPGPTERVQSLFCGDDDCVVIASEDEAETRSTVGIRGKIARLKGAKSEEAFGRFLIHRSRGHNWFGKYAQTDNLRHAKDEAEIFFGDVLQVTRAGGLEGRLRTAIVNRYERDPSARAACIRIHGRQCAVCKFDFGDNYGIELGRGFIHVHHLTPISDGGGTERPVDPRTDLIPVCPNCHAMLHRRSPPIEPDDLRKVIRPR